MTARRRESRNRIDENEPGREAWRIIIELQRASCRLQSAMQSEMMNC